jgi:16S rRNA G527 N7-methylase RsmG
MVIGPGSIQPVWFGFTEAVHAPAWFEGAVGGNGNSVISIGSGAGGFGVSAALTPFKNAAIALDRSNCKICFLYICRQEELFAK